MKTCQTEIRTVTFSYFSKKNRSRSCPQVEPATLFSWSCGRGMTRSDPVRVSRYNTTDRDHFNLTEKTNPWVFVVWRYILSPNFREQSKRLRSNHIDLPQPVFFLFSFSLFLNNTLNNTNPFASAYMQRMSSFTCVCGHTKVTTLPSSPCRKKQPFMGVRSGPSELNFLMRPRERGS